MSLFKCKICGGTIEFEPGSTVGVCDHCGTKQTLPRLDDDRKANLYDRADHFRRNNDFDKAAGIYEMLLNEDKTDAEAYWLLVLCRYGVEYVEDPATRKRIPTVNRTQYVSIFDDADYRSALEYADAQQRAIYEAEAAAINEIQKGILAISQKEEPFDVFICYKETDAHGRRTPDSVLATDLYHQLVNEGFKVFFSRITLEDKLGTAYEPYIFAALNSAKVMVVLGTKPEYFNAVWVKNEWSRYLALVKASNGKKILIPAYRDMDPYDLPEEFSHLQAQDMSKLGFMQDLIRGIKKLTAKSEPKPVVKETVDRGTTSAAGVNVNALLKRVFMFLEDGDWKSANEYAEKVLDQDPENANAYLGKLMAELHVKKPVDLAECEQPFDNNGNYQKAVRFGSDKVVAALKSYNTHIKKRNETDHFNSIYNKAVNAMNAARTEEEFDSAAKAFKTISGFKDAEALAEKCEYARKDRIYKRALEKLKYAKTIEDYYRAQKMFSEIAGHRDVDKQFLYIAQRIIQITKTKKKQKQKTIVFTIVIILFFACVISMIKINSVIKQKKVIEKYGNAFKTASVGETIKLGHYEQDNNDKNGEEDIEWLVLNKEAQKMLVISKYALDCEQYNTSQTNVTWETCSLRKWMNNTFLVTAFNQEERILIKNTSVKVGKNPSYDTAPGLNTMDKVFLLSAAEANEYFSSDIARQCKGSAYCYAKGAYVDGNANCRWWLRSPGFYSFYATIVSCAGPVTEYGLNVCNDDITVRPAMWINLS